MLTSKRNLFISSVYVICIVVLMALAYLVTTTLRTGFERSKLVQHGLKTIASIDLKDRNENKYKLTYSFTIDNKTYTQTVKFVFGKDEQLQSGDKVWVIYLPEKPTINELIRDENGYVLKISE